MAANQKIEFNCNASDPVSWIFVEVLICRIGFAKIANVSKVFELIFFFANSQNNKDAKNESVLKLDQVTNQHVGYYYCVKQSLLQSRFNGSVEQMEHRDKFFEDLFYEGLAARIYLFVNGMLLLHFIGYWNRRSENCVNLTVSLFGAPIVK